MQNKLRPFLILAILAGIGGMQAQAQVRIVSPNGDLEFIFSPGGNSNSSAEPIYHLKYRGENIVLDSRLGLRLENQPDWTGGLEIRKETRSGKDTAWHPLYGEKSMIPDKYNELTLELSRKNHSNHVLQFRVRAYDEGIAFRYQFAEGQSPQTLHINGENTEFRFPRGTRAWYTERPQGEYRLLPLEDWEKPAEMPLTLELENGFFASVLEAGVVNYTVSRLETFEGSKDALGIEMRGSVIETPPFSTPWRVVMVADTPGKLLENNHIVLNLNPPSLIENPWWITPGKVIREVTLSTDGAKACVDFAVERNLQYIHFDAGWYGHEYHAASDATTVTVDPRRNPAGDLDLHEAIRYARSRGIKVFVYVNHRALERQLDELFPLYKSWGIDGIKFGFVHTGSHRWNVWLHEAIEKAARHQLMVNVHDRYRPTGFSRTYPNFMTMEGIRGNEEMPEATHSTILPFTRYIAGRGDHTICYYYRKEFGHPNRHIKTTPAHQLALAVVTYSPLQWLFWYDRPEDYQGEPEIEFFENVPTVWDDTRVLDGSIGSHAVIARKSGEDWFVGAVSNNEGRVLDLPLDFLEEGRTYQLSVYTDGGEEIPTRTRVKIERLTVDRKDVIRLVLKPSGGAALHLRLTRERRPGNGLIPASPARGE